MKTFIIIFTSAMLFFCGCKDETTAPPASSELKDFLQPLAVGNMWVYYHEAFDATGPTHTLYDTIKVLRDTIIGNEKWFLLSDYSLYNCLTNKIDGLYAYSGSSTRVYQYPANIGDTLWLSQLHSRTVASISDTISGNGNVLQNIKYADYYTVQGESYIGQNYYWYAPNVGCTKYEFYVQYPPANQYIWHRAQLVYYKLN
jgi:hypothetical protein